MFKRRAQRTYWDQARDFIWPQSGWRRAFAYMTHRIKRLPGTPQSIAAGVACGVAEHKLLSGDSRAEQSGAGLDQCSESEFVLFQEMNAMYFGKFGFPFIIAVKGRNRQEILAAFRERLNNSADTEFKTALRQVCQIASFRIGDILND